MKGLVNLETQVLLGFTRNNEVVFGDVGYRGGRFSASFDCSYPIEITKEVAIEAIENYIDCMDKAWVLDKLEYHDCKPSELAEEIYRDSDDIVGEFFDNSLYTESFRIDGYEDDIYFLFSSCGQHDTRQEMSIYINKELYDEIHRLWDKHHLDTIDFDDVKEIFEAIEHQNNTINEYAIVENWLINHAEI